MIVVMIMIINIIVVIIVILIPLSINNTIPPVMFLVSIIILRMVIKTCTNIHMSDSQNSGGRKQ